MLFSSKTDGTSVQSETRIADAGKVVLGGGFRLPATTTDKGAIRLGGGFRLPASVADKGSIRLGGGFRLPVQG